MEPCWNWGQQVNCIVENINIRNDEYIAHEVLPKANFSAYLSEIEGKKKNLALIAFVLQKTISRQID